MIADEIRALAQEMTAAGENLSPQLRARFIAMRTALFERGIYDPVLARFDSATVARASVAEVAAQLAAVATSL